MQSLRRSSKSLFCHLESVFTRVYAHENVQPGIVGKTRSFCAGISILECDRCLRNHRTARIPHNSVESGCGLGGGAMWNHKYQYQPKKRDAAAESEFTRAR